MERLAVEPTELLSVKDAPVMVPPSAVNGTVSVKAPPLRMESSPGIAKEPFRLQIAD